MLRDYRDHAETIQSRSLVNSRLRIASKNPLLQWNGIHNKFSQGFMNIMYTNNTHMAAVKSKARFESTLLRKKESEISTLHKIESMQQKKFIAQYYIDKHNLNITPYDLERHTVEELEELLRKRCILFKETNAAVCIQRNARRMIC